ncbi:MAG: hypothetical protein ACTSP5_09505 [Candidatus Heimdallarchaeota archaeon]
MPKNKDQTEISEKRKKRKESMKGFGNWIKLFSMRWRFRLDQSRAIFGLITFALLLALSYAKYLPDSWLINPDDIPFWIVLVFTLFILIIFIIGGYIYDKFLKLWSQTTAVNVARNPYTYVPAPKELIVILGWWVHTFNTLSQIAKKLDIEIEGEDMIKQQLSHYLTLSVDDTDFEFQAKKLQRLTGILIDSYLESDEEEDFDEFLANLEQYMKKSKKK